LQALQTASQFAYSGLQNVFYRQTLSAMWAKNNRNNG